MPSNKKRLTVAAKQFQKEMEDLYYLNDGEIDWWQAFITVLERKNLEGDTAVKMWYSLRLPFRNKLRKEFSKLRKTCSRWR